MAEILSVQAAAAYAEKLFSHTRDGKLKLWSLLFPSEVTNDLSMRWTQADLPALVQQYEALQKQLVAIAPLYKQLLADPACRARLPNELAQTWDIYVRPLPGKPNSLSTALDCRQEALTRLPMKGCNPAGLLYIANRYTHLISIDSPEILLQKDGQRLLAELALYLYAEPFEPCRYCGHAMHPGEAGEGCPVCGWIEDGSGFEEMSEANGVPLKYYYILAKYGHRSDP